MVRAVARHPNFVTWIKAARAFGIKFMNGDGILVFVLAPGAFIALGYLLVLFNKLKT